MAGMGTGTPIWFKCPSQRSNTRTADAMHRVHRTGRTKPNPSRRRTQRTLDTMHEYECSCGRTGWSRIVGILDWPLKNDG